MRRIPLTIAAMAIAVTLAACDPATVVDQAIDPTSPASSGPADASLIGLTRDQLPADVRIARIGDEHFALTEDHVLGRRTVELDRGADGVARVVTVLVEVEHGVVTLVEGDIPEPGPAS